MTPQITPQDLQRLCAEKDKLKLGLLADNTRNGYGLDWALFCAWCETCGYASLPAEAETVALYLTHLIVDERRKVATADRRSCAIRHYHIEGGHPSPITTEVRRVLVGARRILCEQPRQMRPLTVAQLRLIVAPLAASASRTAARDRAILVVGLASGARCSTLAMLDVSDLEFCPKGAILTIRKEKTDQAGRGRLIGLPPGEHPQTCPVRALEGWLLHRGSQPGPLFTRLDPGNAGKRLERNRVRKIVQGSMMQAGIDPEGYGAHSMRSGLVTEAAENGCPEMITAAQTGHRSTEMLRRYYRRAQLFNANAAAMIGL